MQPRRSLLSWFGAAVAKHSASSGVAGLVPAACVCSAPCTRGPGVIVVLITHRRSVLSGGREGPETKPACVPAARFHLCLPANYFSSFSRMLCARAGLALGSAARSRRDHLSLLCLEEVSPGICLPFIPAPVSLLNLPSPSLCPCPYRSGVQGIFLVCTGISCQLSQPISLYYVNKIKKKKVDGYWDKNAI